MTDSSLETIFDRFQLEPHPEGGFYREMYRADLTLPADVLPAHDGPRSAGTSIIYLLPHGDMSSWHRVASDELWLWQGGDAMTLTMRRDEDDERTRVVGPAGELQVLVPANCWQTATPADGDHGYSLVGCVVVPGFDFADFEMA